MFGVNIGKTDRIARLVIGLGLIATVLFTGLISASSAIGIIAIIVGVVLAATAAIKFCPLYRLLGMRTCPVE